MTVRRLLFELSDTGSQIDTGPAASGRVEQYRWVGTGDTGGNIDIGIYPRAGDTGDGWLIVSNAGLAGQLRASFNPTDTGVATYMAMDRVRVAKTGAASGGRLYLWISD